MNDNLLHTMSLFSARYSSKLSSLVNGQKSLSKLVSEAGTQRALSIRANIEKESLSPLIF